MTGLQNQGLLGLTHQAGKRESARADLNTLSQLHSLKKGEEAQEQQAALVEQQYYDGIRAEADKLLVGDRKKINAKAVSIQSEIRKNIKLFGGSRKKFMANGGVAMIGDYKNQVLDSNEFTTYKENKVNMERILDLKQKNLGHLLTPQDQLALENYERTGSGKITYSGLMSEIEIPESNLFDYGSQIGPSDIVATGSNKMKLLSNYMLEYPDAVPPNPQTSEGMETLRNYVIAKGYGGKGSNTSSIQYQGKARQTASAKAAKAAKEIHTVSGLFQAGFSQEISIPIDKITPESFVMNNFWDGLIGDKFTSDFNTRASQNPEIGETLIEGPFGNAFNDTENGYTPRGARKLPKSYSNKFLVTKFGDGATIEGNKLKGFTINPEEAYTANGKQLDKEISSGDYEIMDSFIGWKTDIDGIRSVVVDAKNEDNKFDEERNKTLYSTEEGSNKAMGSPSIFVMIRDEDTMYDDDYYIEIPYGSVLSQNSFKQIMGEEDDVTDLIKENNQTKTKIDSGTVESNIIKQSQVNSDIDINNEAFSSEVFNFQNANYNPNGEGSKRNNLRKAFYLAGMDISGNVEGVQSVINKDMFKSFFEMSGLGNELTGNMNDNQLLNRILQETSGTPEEIQNNRIFVGKMKNYLLEIYSK